MMDRGTSFKKELQALCIVVTILLAATLLIFGLLQFIWVASEYRPGNRGYNSMLADAYLLMGVGVILLQNCLRRMRELWPAR